MRTSDDPYLNFGRVASFFSDVQIGGKHYKQVTARDLYREREVKFAASKDATTFRIFCVGSSASAGWPHPAGETYSAYLQSALAKAYPHRPIEVINVSAHAYAAYRQRLILNEVLEYQPDLIIIYSGNNEFIEPRRYAADSSWRNVVSAAANMSVVYKVARGTYPARTLFPDNTFLPQARSKVAFEAWSKIEQLPLALKTDPTQLKKVEEHYEFSITSMVRAANARGVPVILLTVPTNLRDWQPNVSLVSVQGEQERQWKEQYQAGRSALLKGNAEVAAAAFAAASTLDPGHAASHYYRGRALEIEGKFTEAYEAYDLSRNLDANPFRAIGSFNAIIRRAARESKNARLVDAEQLFREDSFPRAPGFNLLLDYVHPTTRGNIILAKGVFEAIVGGRYIAPESLSGFPNLTTYDETKDQSLQRTLIVLGMMMHQYEMIVDKSELIASNPGGFEALGKVESARMQTIYRVFRDVVEQERRELLSSDVRSEERESLKTRVNQVYQDLFSDYKEFQRQVAQ